MVGKDIHGEGVQVSQGSQEAERNDGKSLEYGCCQSIAASHAALQQHARPMPALHNSVKPVW